MLSPGLSAWLALRLLDRAGGHRRRVLEAAQACADRDRWPRPQLDAHRDGQLRALLEHAVRAVPRFRDLPLPTRSDDAAAVLRRWPVMRRADIQAAPAAFIDPAAADTRPDATGGSTGTPMAFRVDPATQLAREASLIWADGLSGWRPGDRLAMLWGADRDVQLAHRTWRGALRLLVENRRWYNSFDMGPERMARYHRQMAAFRPHLLVGYAGSLDVFARWLEAEGCRPHYPLAAIVSSAEMLTPAVRERVERVFGRPVFDRYGNREAGAIAAECPSHAGLHVNDSDFHIEILSPDPLREPGPLLVTYFRNRAMPLIRYDTGDLGLLAPGGACGCGRHTMRLARVVGRQSDTLRTRAGRLIHGEYFTHLLYGQEAVREFQFVQDSLDDYRLVLVADPVRCRDREAEWCARIRAEVGAEARVRVEYVAAIPLTASGKRKFTISHLSP